MTESVDNNFWMSRTCIMSVTIFARSTFWKSRKSRNSQKSQHYTRLYSEKSINESRFWVVQGCLIQPGFQQWLQKWWNDDRKCWKYFLMSQTRTMTVTKCGRRENREIRENRENRGADKSRDFWLDIFLEANEIGNGRRHSRDEWNSYDRLCLQEKNLTSRLAGTPLQNRTFEFRDFQVNFANFATSPHPRSQRPDHSHHRPSLAAAVNMEHSLVSVWRRGHRGVS